MAKTLSDLLLTMMQDVYYAERQILKALPKLAKAAESEALKQALMHHREETEGQVERLQKAFEAAGTWQDLRDARTGEAGRHAAERAREEQHQPGSNEAGGLRADARRREDGEAVLRPEAHSWPRDA